MTEVRSRLFIIPPAVSSPITATRLTGIIRVTDNEENAESFRVVIKL